ncbi:hypothetical protein PIB30_087867, partial [Stylosanthes scabra]|nr:hypothetical protein [Stylosanthes scabra]
RVRRPARARPTIAAEHGVRDAKRGTRSRREECERQWNEQLERRPTESEKERSNTTNF